MKRVLLVILISFCVNQARGQEARPSTERLRQLQQEFVDLKFGMFIHFNISTYMNEVWADPEAPASLFNPVKLDCNQWARAAKSANMSYGCITSKHHTGFCIWDTKTTDYNVMNSPLRRDVVREYADAFRAQGLKVMIYFSILDIRHKLRPGWITEEHTELVKAQITELLTNYGEITALILDGWDAPWSRISYEDVPFEEIYDLVKRLQPDCLVMDLNAGKYPPEVLFYTDIKSYEQGSGQLISKENNRLPALSCLPINSTWFWRTSFPTEPVKDPLALVNDNLIPFNNVWCNFILNVAPNRDGLIDDNVLTALKTIGLSWKNDGVSVELPPADAPIVSANLAKFKPANSSWGWDMHIMDFGNDDVFWTAWVSHPDVTQPWFEVELGEDRDFNMVTIADARENIQTYRVQYHAAGAWKTIVSGNRADKIKIHRFDRVRGDKVRVVLDEFSGQPAIAEFGVYNESR